MLAITHGGMNDFMSFFKKITLFRLYLALCVLAVSAFTYAEYYGYVLTGSDESQRATSSNYIRSNHTNGLHHK